MCLQKFLRRFRTHFRGNDTQQIILHTHYVHGREGVVFNYDFQCAGKFLGLLPLPVETLAYGHSVQFKSGLGKKGGRGLLLEVKLVIKGTVIVDFAFAESGHAGTSPIRVHPEFDAIGRHYAHADVGLDTGQAADDSLLIFLGESNFGEDFGEKFFVHFLKVGLHRSYQVASHIGTSGAHREVVRSFGKIMVGTVTGAEDYY